MKLRPAIHGASLVVTLLVISILTVIVVAFLQSMSVERATARTYSGIYRASLAADAAVQDAAFRLQALMRENPYHAIGYKRLPGSTNVATGVPAAPYPVFMGAPTANEEPTEHYMVSGAPPTGPLAIADLTANDSFDLNQNFSGAFANGWIGSPLLRFTNTNWQVTPRPKRAPWVNILQDPGLPEQPNPSQANYNPVVARYAYWVEDESSKLDITQIGNTEGPSNAFARTTPASTEPDQLDFGALPVTERRPLPDTTASAPINVSLGDFQDVMKGFPIDDRILGQLVLVGKTAGLEDIAKFHTTQFSLSNELSSTGRRRINLNAIVTNSTDPNIIAADLSDIIFAMTGKQIFDFPGSAHSIYGPGSNATHSGVFLDQEEDTGNAPLPDFGMRFYNNPAFPAPIGGNLKSDHEAVYLLKLAANIRDYIDTGSQPTFVDFSGTVLSGNRPGASWLGGEEPIAIGKEAVPYLQEHTWWGRLDNVQIIPGANPSNRRSIDFRMDHFFEFLNPATKDFTAPPGTILKVYNLPSMDGEQFSDLELPDFELDLTGLVFPAGRATVVTTAPAGEAPTGMMPASAIVLTIDPGDAARIFIGHLANAEISGGTGNSRRFGTRMVRDGSASSTDYTSELIMSTPLGAIDAFPHLSLITGGGSPLEMSRSVDGTRGTWSIAESDRNNRRFVFGNSLRGNDEASRSGDPRSLNEQMETVGGSNSAFGSDQARFFTGFEGTGTDIAANTSFPNRMTMGSAAISFVAPSDWPDYHVTLADNANTAYAVVSDLPMVSIGELGHIYDPYRILGPEGDGTSGFTTPPATTRIRRARGGGRTLKVGQPETNAALSILGNNPARFFPPSSTSAGWFNAAWRLTDVFSALPSTTEATSEPTAPAKINVNGVMRDGGLALRAAARSFFFLPAPEGDTARAGRQISENELNQFINNLTSYLTTFGPMMERGELSQLTFFNSNAVTAQAGGQRGGVSMDRSREEIFRRIAELITTRSLSYSIYAVGQTVRQDANGNISVVASDRQRSIIAFDPVIGEEITDLVTDYTWRTIDVSR